MENGYVSGWMIEPVLGLVSKFKTSWWWRISALIVLWSLSPLLLDLSSYPPGDDPFRLEQVAARGWNDYKYLGYIPIKIIGVSLYYYLTPLLSYIGLLYFYGMEKRWSAVIAMGIIYGLMPALYFNLGAGTWISIVNFMLVGLVTVKVVHQLGMKPSSKRLVIASLILTFILPVIHNETGSYIALVTFGAIILTRKWRISYLLLSTLAGLYVTFYVMGGSGNTLIVEALEGNQVHKVLEITDDEGVVHRTHAAAIPITEDGKLARDVPVVVVGGKTITATPENTVVQDVRLAWWAKFMLSDNYIPFALLSLAVYLYFARPHFTFHKPSLMLLTALPIMMFFAWTPWEVSGIRLGIYIAVIVGIFHASVLGQIFQYHKDEWLKFTFVIIGGFYFLAGSSNTWISWLFARA